MDKNDNDESSFPYLTRSSYVKDFFLDFFSDLFFSLFCSLFLFLPHIFFLIFFVFSSFSRATHTLFAPVILVTFICRLMRHGPHICSRLFMSMIVICRYKKYNERREKMFTFIIIIICASYAAFTVL